MTQPSTSSSPPSDIPTSSIVHCRPQSVGELFWAFSALALQGFGGVLAVAQRELVEKRQWFTKEQFVEEWSVAQVLPGPNVVNLSLMFGDREMGLRGALAAMAGLLIFPLLLLVALTLVYTRFHDLPAVQGALRGMGAVAAGLIAATALKLASALRKNPLRRPLAYAVVVMVFAAVAVMRWPLPAVLLGIGGPVCLLVAKRL